MSISKKVLGGMVRKRSGASLAAIALATGISMSSSASAGVTGYVTVHNYRDEPVRVLVNWGFRGTVSAHSSQRFLVGDDEDTTTWVSAEKTGGDEVKRSSYTGYRTDVEFDVY